MSVKYYAIKGPAGRLEYGTLAYDANGAWCRLWHMGDFGGKFSEFRESMQRDYSGYSVVEIGELMSVERADVTERIIGFGAVVAFGVLILTPLAALVACIWLDSVGW